MPELQTPSKGWLATKYHFWLYLLLAAILLQLPFASVPFKWLESYFHEISHGLAALLTGGKIMQIELFANGAGLCTTRGGSRFLIAFMGYAGATLWGFLIYSLASANQRMAQALTVLLMLLLASSLIFWVRDVLTLIILLVLLGLFALKLKLGKMKYLQWLLQFTGIMVLLNSLQSPFYLLDGRGIGDGANLANLTGIPEFIWVIVWFSLGLAAAYSLAKRN